MWQTVTDILTYIGIVLVGFFIWAALSPFELLGWWAGWFGEKIYDGGVPGGDEDQPVTMIQIAILSLFRGSVERQGKLWVSRTRIFATNARQFPETVFISDLFPYSVNNLPLTAQPLFASLWRWALRRKMNGPALAGYLINLRNIWQLMISADKRYGPMYNQAVAEIIVNGLLRYGYDPKSGARLS